MIKNVVFNQLGHEPERSKCKRRHQKKKKKKKVCRLFTSTAFFARNSSRFEIVFTRRVFRFNPKISVGPRSEISAYRSVAVRSPKKPVTATHEIDWLDIIHLVRVVSRDKNINAALEQRDNRREFKRCSERRRCYCHET